MGPSPGDYDDRYLAGVVCFNRGDYFDAHEVWEELWMDCPAADRRFYQSLIQAAVALYHWGNGNRAGAARLFESGRRYMGPYRPHYRGLDVDRFWQAVELALAPALANRDREGAGDSVDRGRPARSSQPQQSGRDARGPEDEAHPLPGGRGSQPCIVLDPAPARWPDPDEGSS